MVATAANRVFKAAKHDMPLNEYHLFFCRERACRTKYAQHVTNAARGTKSLSLSLTWVLALVGVLSIIAIGAYTLT